MKRIAPKQTKDSLTGRWLCRSCQAPVGKGRSVYCSRECYEDFSVRYFPSFTRIAVRKRDHGICAKCGCDTEKIARIFGFVHWHNTMPMHPQDIRRIAFEMGFLHWYQSGSLWQADHVHECVRGGWGKGLENFRTLCTPCHKEETARLAKERAEERRKATRN